MNEPVAISHTERLWRDRAEYWCVEFTKKEAGENLAKAHTKLVIWWCKCLFALFAIEFVALVCAGIWIFGQIK